MLNLPLKFIPVPRLFGLLASLVAVGVMGWAGPVAAQALRDLPPPGAVASG